MKTDKKQHVRSKGIISLFVLLGVSALICVPVWSGRSGATQQRTLHRAESLAYQLLESRKVNSSRGPASVDSPVNHLTMDEGDVGLDPWGHPYHYKLLKANENQLAKILVWSMGPNGKSETADDVIESNRDSRSPQFSGDDLGIMLSVK
jgi:type II secretory pathway pseudopilin PulG